MDKEYLLTYLERYQKNGYNVEWFETEEVMLERMKELKQLKGINDIKGMHFRLIGTYQEDNE